MKLVLTAARWVVTMAVMIVAHAIKVSQLALVLVGEALNYLKPSETFTNVLVGLLTDYGTSKINSFKSKTKLVAGNSVQFLTEDFEHRRIA